MLLVVHPAIGAILAAKAILHRMDPVLEERGYGVLDAGQIAGVDAAAPKGWIFQILGRRVAEHTDDIVADKSRCEIAGRLEAIDHHRRRAQ